MRSLSGLRSLPISLPIAANRVSQRQPERTVAELPVVLAAMIFHPRRMGRVMVKMLRADVVMLATDHQAKAS